MICHRRVKRAKVSFLAGMPMACPRGMPPTFSDLPQKVPVTCRACLDSRLVSRTLGIALIGMVMLAAGLSGAAGCSGQPGVVPGSPTPALPGGAKTPGGLVVITGQVREVDASARVIVLVEPVHGLDTVAVTDQTEIEALDGSRRQMVDVHPGVVIQAAGTPSGSGSVLASKVRILTGPSPLPQ